MNLLENELNKLKEDIAEMMKLVKKQTKKSKKAFLEMDSDRAEEIIHHEKRVNALELSIDRNCENILALYKPVAVDLRFVISMLKINSDLERIGDYAEGTAKYIIELETKFSKEILDTLQVAKIFQVAIEMIEDIREAFKQENTDLAMKLFKKDKDLNKLCANASSNIAKIVEKDPKIIRPSLFLFSTIRRLERTGDHVKNIAEEIIFYLEAEVLKHKPIK